MGYLWSRSMPAEVTTLKVFIASPSDLDAERATLRKLEASLNVAFASAKLAVRFTGWEEVPPGYGRPQAKINPLVDECDIFIGLLRRRWGTATGEHESGFLEEYERASLRRKEGGAEPEIALYFAAISRGEIDDAGPDLRKVLKFKKKVENEHIALYDFFTSPEDLGVKVKDLLNRHLIDRLLEQQTPTTPEGATTGKPDEHVPTARGPQTSELDEAGAQINAVLDTLRALVHRLPPEAPLDQDRLELIGTSLGRDDTTLGAHLTNRLYRRRRELHLIVAEHRCWFHTLLEDVGLRPDPASRVIPGWALSRSTDPDLPHAFVRYATLDNHAGAGALRSLHRLHLRPDDLWPADLGGKSTASGDQPDTRETDPSNQTRARTWAALLNNNVSRDVATDYLLQDADSSDSTTLAALDKFLGHIHSSPDLNEESRKLLEGFRQALAGEPDSLADLLRYKSGDNAQWRLVERNLDKVSPDLINELANLTYNRRAKVSAIRAGLATGALTEKTLTDLLNKDDLEISDLLVESARDNPEIALEWVALMANSDKKLSPLETEAPIIAYGVPIDVIKHMNATSDLTVTPWAALTYALPEEMTHEAREVLRTDAAALRTEFEPTLGGEHQTLLNYLAEEQNRAAAHLLARSGSTSDEDLALILQWVGRSVSHGFFRDYVWRILVLAADDSNLTQISDAIRPHHAVSGFRQGIDYFATQLAPVLAELTIDGTDRGLRDKARVWHTNQPDRTNEELRAALYDESSDVRITAAQGLVQRLEREELATLQDEYPDVEGQFWYNVIALFDEHLYAPTPAADA